MTRDQAKLLMRSGDTFRLLQNNFFCGFDLAVLVSNNTEFSELTIIDLMGLELRIIFVFYNDELTIIDDT